MRRGSETFGKFSIDRHRRQRDLTRLTTKPPTTATNIHHEECSFQAASQDSYLVACLREILCAAVSGYVSFAFRNGSG